MCCYSTRCCRARSSWNMRPNIVYSNTDGPTNRYHLATIGLHSENAFGWATAPRHHLGNEVGLICLIAALGRGYRISDISHSIPSIELRPALSLVMKVESRSMFPLAFQVTTSPMANVIKSHQHPIQFRPNTRRLVSGHTESTVFM